MNFTIRNRILASQRGASLVVTMVMLVAVMLLGLSAWQLSRSQGSLAGNLQFQALAFGEAEAGTAQAEQWLATGTNYDSNAFRTYTSGTGLYPQSYLANNNIDPLMMDWTDSNSAPGSTASQRYLIELLATNKQSMSSGVGVGSRGSTGCDQVNTYRIVTRGESARGATRFVQSIFSVLSCPS